MSFNTPAFPDYTGSFDQSDSRIRLQIPFASSEGGASYEHPYKTTIIEVAGKQYVEILAPSSLPNILGGQLNTGGLTRYTRGPLPTSTNSVSDLHVVYLLKPSTDPTSSWDASPVLLQYQKYKDLEEAEGSGRRRPVAFIYYNYKVRQITTTYLGQYDTCINGQTGYALAPI
jgi:hypothetical protein